MRVRGESKSLFEKASFRYLWGVSAIDESGMTPYHAGVPGNMNSIFIPLHLTWRTSKALVVGIALASPAMAQITVRSGTAADVAGITPFRNQFRTDLGGGAVAGANGLFDDGVRQRREVNWDGVPATLSAPNSLPATFFNVNSPRGVVFSTPGTGFQVSGATTDAGAGQPAAANFGNIDASYTAQFLQFSAQRLFTEFGVNIMDVSFFLPGTAIPAGTRGFGVMFTGVELDGTTSLQLFDLNNVSLGIFNAVPQSGATGFSFLGASLASGLSQIGRVRITTGNAALGPGVMDTAPLAGTDLVVMDDFIFGNPIPEGSTLAGAVISVVGLGLCAARRRQQQRA